MIFKKFLSPLFLLFPLSFIAQNPKPFTPQNIVPNPGFEDFSDYPLDWYITGDDFNRVSLYWTSPTNASPDIYAPTVKIPPDWKAVGFGQLPPYQGSAFAGLTVFGCNRGKPHCREYIQIHLTEPLVPGQRYVFSAMIAQLPRSTSIRNLGIWFNSFELDEDHIEPLLNKAVLMTDKFIPDDGRWHKWSGQFVADSASEFLIIGNFQADNKTYIRQATRKSLGYGYYYIDEVSLYKIPPILTAPVPPSPLRNYVPKAGEVVTLSRIYFEHDRADFLPYALVQLDQLLTFVKKYPSMKIEIIGHTDLVGSPEYNLGLSMRRSEAVKSWLISKGVQQSRLTTSGKGSSMPIADNNTSQGRSYNRRVEIRVLSI